MNQLYYNARMLFLTGGIDWTLQGMAIALYDVGGAYNATHSLLTDVGGIQINAGGLLENPTADGGYAVADDYTYVMLSSANAVRYGVMYRISDGLLVAHLASVDGIPFTPNGGDYTIKGNGPNGAYFRI